ncbi:MAG: TetR/AcrR family transcriptional regulator [Pseudomonadota bacterium]
MPSPTAALPSDNTRRSQPERTAAMRWRLMEATVQSLAEEGFAKSTLSAIVRRAGVSRGAQVHHFPTRQILMIETAEHLLLETYKDLGQLVLSIAEENRRLEALVQELWETLFGTQRFTAYLELLAASQHDPELAGELKQLVARTVELYDPAGKHYFKRRKPNSVAPRLLFIQLCALLSGLAAHRHLVTDEHVIDNQLQLWVKQAAVHLMARPGVSEPPPLEE